MTVLNELKESILSNIVSLNNTVGDRSDKTYLAIKLTADLILRQIDSLLVKEKQQIIEAFETGYGDFPDGKGDNGEDYFNQTYISKS